MSWLQIVYLLTGLGGIGNLTLGTLTDVATDIDDKYLVCKVYLSQMHIIEHFLSARFPNLFITRMSEQTDTDDNAAFQRQPFLDFKELILETGTSAKRDDFVILYHSLM